MDLLIMMKINFNIMLFLFITTTRKQMTCASDCIKSSSCSCQYKDGGKIDLSPLANDNGDATFKEIRDSIGLDTYYWNPCKAFTLDKCQKVAVCDVHQNIPNTAYFPLGTQDSADFSTNSDGKLQITYTYNDGDATRSAAIVLTCDKISGNLIANGELSPGNGSYTFELQSKHACKTFGSFSGSSSGLTVGSIICIVFFVMVFVYLIAGITLNIFVWHNSGKKVIPQSEFWFSLPGLIKDGILFVFRRGKQAQYNKI